MYFYGLRNRGFYDGAGANVDLIYDGTLIPNIASETHHWTVIRQMFDKLNPVGIGGYRAVSPCHSLDIKGTPIHGWSGTNSSWNFDANQNFSWKADPRPATSAEVEAYFDAVTTIPVGELQSVRLDAWNKYHTEIPTIVSIANFIFELKDFQKYYDLLKKIPQEVRNLSKYGLEPYGHGLRKAKYIRDYKKTLNGGNLSSKDKKAIISASPFGNEKSLARRAKDGAARVNDSFLEYNFAWAPFVGDLLKLGTLIQSVHSRLQYLIKTRGVPTKVSLFRPGFVEIPIPSDYATVKDYGADSNGTHELRQLKMLKSKATFASHAMLYQELDGLDDAWAEFRAIIAALGLGSPATIVWNAIPFSFMLDWIFPVGKWLQRFAVQPYSGRWDIYDVSNSVKVEATIEESVYRRRNGSSPYVRTPLRTFSVNSYHRELGLNLSFEDVGFTSLTSHQQQLFASLVAGNTLFKSKHH
jgi:hypothetical protein